MKKIALIGSGSWGTALALTLGSKGYEVRMWDANAEHVKEMKENRENKRYLPGIKFHDTMKVVDTNKEAIEGVDVVLFAIPAQFFRSGVEAALPYLKKEMIIVNVAKGIEQKSLKRMSEIAFEVFDGKFPEERYAVLSGPSHAEEVGLGTVPTTVAIACKDENVAKEVQQLFLTDNFRTYTNDDIIGLEFGGSLKNVLALGAGISDGLGYGDNTRAALMTRGIVEMRNLGVAFGAKEKTFTGLSGMGDLIVTCTSVHSRNHSCGELIGKGMDPQEAVKAIGMVVEGMYTTEAAVQLAKKAGIEMPITEAIFRIINGEEDAKQAVNNLMHRALKSEL